MKIVNVFEIRSQSIGFTLVDVCLGWSKIQFKRNWSGE